MNSGKKIAKKNNLIKLVLFLTFILLLIYYFLSPTPISSPAYYVAKNGNDNNPGTEAQPWRTITKAADTAIAGDTVYVKEGTYNEKILIKNSGRPSNYITFAAYPGDNVTIDGMGISLGLRDGLVQIDGSGYINLSGFRIINSKFMGVMVTRDYYETNSTPTNITIEKNYISNIASSAIYIEDGKDITIDGNEITKAQTMEGLSHQTYETLSLVNVSGFEIKNNKLYQNNAESIDAKDGSSNGRIYHNDISRHQSAGIYIDAWNRTSHDIEIFSNIIHDGRDSGRGIALAVENGGSLKNVKAFNNVIYRNAATGMDISWYSKGPVDNILITGNTIYNNGQVNDWGGGISVDYNSATNVIIRNNIVSKNNHYSIRVRDAGAVVDHNLIDGYIGEQYETRDSYNIEGDPQFVNPANADFHLKSTSPAIGMGSSDSAPVTDFDGNSRPTGAGYDIGAFEYIPALISTSTPIPILISSPIYYVASNGNDNNPGTEAQPWRTITKAADTAVAGDTVYVKNGVYNEQVWVKNSGSADKWINFTAYPGDTVTIDGTGISMAINPNGDRWNGLFNIHGKSYIKVSGFRFANSEYAGFFVTKDYTTDTPSSNIIFSNNYLENTWAAAIIMLGEASTKATNFIVDGNTLVQSHSGGDWRGMEGITLGHNLDGFEIKNNFIKDSHLGLIDAKNGVWNGKIYRNTCVNSSNSCVYVDGYEGGASNIDVFENVAHDMISESEEDVVSGFNVASEQGGLVENISFHNNMAYNNSGDAMIIPAYSIGPVKNITITSNTFYNNGVGNKHRGGIVIDYDNATGIVVKNNILSQNNEFQIWSTNSDAIIDHNLIDGYRGYYLAETRGTNYIEGDPQFVNPANADFHLKNTSPAIDNGSSYNEPSVDFDGNSRHKGPAFDIGAFEYSSYPLSGANGSK